MKTSDAGKALITRYEGDKLVAYQDQRGIWTIGKGDTKDVYPGLRITQAESDERFERRLAEEFEPAVLRSLVGAPVSQAQFDAMVSLEWNIGTGRLDNPATPEYEGQGGFAGSTVARRHREGRYQEAADAFLLWDKVAGAYSEPHHRRRAEERKLYLSGMVELSKLPEVPTPVIAPLPLVESKAQQARINVQHALAYAGVYAGAFDGILGKFSTAGYNALKTLR